MKPMTKPSNAVWSSVQEGVVLPIVLIFLVIMTLLGITVIRNVTLEERMAGNSRYQQFAFQAAEAALRSCENDVMSQATGMFFDAQPQLGMTVVPPQAPLVTGTYWEPTSANNRWADATYTKAVDLDASYAGLMTARCLVERLTPTASKQGGLPHCPFRVTSRVESVAPAETVMLLQSYLIAPLNSGRSCPIAK